MGFYDETLNTDFCPHCRAQIRGEDAYECITDDWHCSSCNAPLKTVSVTVGSFDEAPYTLYELVIDTRRK